MVVNSHLDTQWNWSIQETIAKFIPDTIRDNVKLLKKYPYYQFNWEGAIRYMMLKEYYPDLFEEMKKYINEGRWNVAGNVIEIIQAVGSGSDKPFKPSTFIHHVYQMQLQNSGKCT